MRTLKQQYEKADKADKVLKIRELATEYPDKATKEMQKLAASALNNFDDYIKVFKLCELSDKEICQRHESEFADVDSYNTIDINSIK